MFAREKNIPIANLEAKNPIQQDCEKRFEKIFGEKIDLTKCESDKLKDFQHHLRNIEVYVSPKETNPFVKDLKEVKNGVNLLIVSHEKAKQDEEADKKITSVYQAFKSMDTIGKLTRNQDIQRAAQIGMVSVELFVSAGQLLAAGSSVLALGPMGAIAAGVFTLANLLGKKKKKQQPDPFATAIAQNFQVISEQIQHLHLEMRTSFEHISRQIGTMHMEMRDSFGHISHQIAAMHIEMRELLSKNFENQRVIYLAIRDVYHVVCEGFKYLENGMYENHKEVITTLDRLEASLTQSTMVSGEKLDSILLQPLRNLLNEANNLREERYEYDIPSHVENTAIECVNWLRLIDGKSSTDWANGAIHLPRRLPVSEHPRIINEILSDTSEEVTKNHLGFLTQYAGYYLGINLLKKNESKDIPETKVMEPVNSVFNPELWGLSLEKYIELKIKFPNYVKDKEDRDFNAIVAAGNNQLMITSALRSFELFAKLFKNYQAVIDTELMPLIDQEFSRINAKLYSEKVRLKGERSTPLFDLRRNLLTIVNSWSDSKPVSTDIEGENIGFRSNLITSYNNPDLASPLLVLAERLGVIYFHRMLNWQHTYKNIGDIRGIIRVKVALKYSPQSARIPVQTNSYDTREALDPDLDGNYILDHWKTMGGRAYEHHTVSVAEMTKIKQMILRVFLHYRTEIFSNLLKQPAFKEILQKLEAIRNLLIHYSIAAGFKLEDVALLKQNVWGAKEIINHFMDYINKIGTCSAGEEELSELPLPMTDMTSVETVSRIILTKLRDYNAENFEKDALGNIQLKISLLNLLKLSDYRVSLENNSEKKSHDEKVVVDVERIQSVVTHLNEVIDELNNAKKELLKKEAHKKESTPSAQLSHSLFNPVAEHRINLDRGKKELAKVHIPEEPPKSSEKIVSQAQQLIIEAKSFGYECQDVKADGNCFFHAIADQVILKKLTHIESDHVSLRKKAIAFIRNHPDEYKDFLDERDGDINNFINRNMVAGTWADHVIISALSRALNVTIVIVRSDRTPPSICRQAAAIATLYVGNEVGRHYQSLIENRGITKTRSLQDYIDSAPFDVGHEVTLTILTHRMIGGR